MKNVGHKFGSRYDVNTFCKLGELERKFEKTRKLKELQEI